MTQLFEPQNVRRYRHGETRYGTRVEALLGSACAVDATLRGHSRDVAAISVAVGKALRLSRRQLAMLELAAVVHDVGKSAVPTRILLKPAPLDEGEWAEMRRHPVLGAELLTAVVPDAVVEIVRSHHERWDGGGYPDGLAGDAIPLGARIVAVVDAYCAMTEPRPYRRADTAANARAELLTQAGTQFDADCAHAAVRVTASTV